MKKIISGAFMLSLVISIVFGGVISAEANSEIPIAPSLSAFSAIATLQAGTDQNNIPVYIKNTSPVPATDIAVTISVKDDAYFRVQSIYGALPMGTLPAMRDLFIPFSIDVAPSTPAGTYELTINTTWKNANYSDSFESSSRVIFHVENDNATIGPEIKDIKFAEPKVVAGKDASLSFEIVNPHTFPLKNVSVKIEGFEPGVISDKNPDRKLSFETLEAGEVKNIKIDMSTSEKMESSVKNFTVTAEAFDSFNNNYSVVKSSFFQVIESSEFTQSSPRIVIESYEMTPKKAQPGDMVTLTLNIKNIGKDLANNLHVVLTNFDATAFTIHEVVPEKVIPSLSVSGTQKLTYSIQLSSVIPQDAPNPIEVQFTFNDSKNNYYKDHTTVNIISKAPEKAPGSDEPVQQSTPRIIIDSYEIIDTSTIEAGKRFLMKFTLKNTSKERSVKNIKVSIDSSSPAGDKGSVFTPADASNSFYIESIGIQKTYECEISLLPSKDAETKIYPLTLNIDYEDDKNRPFNATESIGLSVIQPARLEVSGLNVPETAQIGSPFYIYFNYNNKSRSPLYFLSIDIQGPGTSMEGKQELGSIPSGYNDYFESMITPGETEGIQEYNIVFSFEDASGNVLTKEMPFSINISSMGGFDNNSGMFEDPNFNGGEIDTFEPGIPQQEGGKILGMAVWLFFTIIGVIILIAAAVIIIVVRKHKKRKDELIEDEDN